MDTPVDEVNPDARMTYGFRPLPIELSVLVIPRTNRQPPTPFADYIIQSNVERRWLSDPDRSPLTYPPPRLKVRYVD